MLPSSTDPTTGAAGPAGNAPEAWYAARQKWLLPAIFVLCVARLWVAPLASSFWVDETATAFVVNHGAEHASFRIAPQVPASIYYRLPRAMQSWWGFSETAYRWPSVLLMALAAWAIARIAARLIHADAGWFVLFSCLLLREFNYQAADARPYALGTAVASLGLYFLIRWLDRAHWADALAFVLLGALLWRVHLLFWPVYVLFALYTVVRLGRRESAAKWWQVAVVYAAVGLSLLPVAIQALTLMRQASAHVVVALPGGSDFTRALKVDFVLPFLGLSVLLARWMRWPRTAPVAPASSLVMVFGWWLCQPLCLYLFSHASGNSVFLSRYLYLALPGTALVAAVATGVSLPAKYWRTAAAALGIVILLFQGHWTRLQTAHHNSDWRGAAAAIRAAATPETPIICPSPYIEARPPVWRPDYPVASFLYSYIETYRIRGAVYPFPFETSPEAERWASALAAGPLAAAGRFIVYGGDLNVNFWRTWFSARPEFAGWRVKRLGPFGDVEVVMFEKAQ